MKAFLFALLALSPVSLFAQRMDTVKVKNGTYGVYQVDDHGKQLNPVVVYDKADRLLRRESYRDRLRHGQVIVYDSLGRKAQNSRYSRGYRNGPDTMFYPNGTSHMIIHFRWGELHGVLTSYHPNGQVEWVGGFRKDKLRGERVLHDSLGQPVEGEYTTLFPLNGGYYVTSCINGRPHGKITVYRNDGRLVRTGQFEHGQPEGEWVFFDPNGHVERKDIYRKGRFRYSVETD